MKFLVFAVFLGLAWTKPLTYSPLENSGVFKRSNWRVGIAEEHDSEDGHGHVVPPELDRSTGYHPMENPNLFQGDIMGFDGIDDRNVITDLRTRWPGAVVPYVIDPSLSHSTPLIEKSMDDYREKTCVRFVPRTNERNYIKLFSGQGCYSFIGMTNRGEQQVSLGQGCLFRGTIVHELGHALGFFHEQNRSDRDTYLTIYWQNIQQGMETQFALLTPSQNLLLNSFDHDSIMLYGNYAFSKDGRSLTMVAKNGKKLLEPYEKNGLTWSDIERVKKMYNC